MKQDVFDIEAGTTIYSARPIYPYRLYGRKLASLTISIKQVKRQTGQCCHFNQVIIDYQRKLKRLALYLIIFVTSFEFARTISQIPDKTLHKTTALAIEYSRHENVVKGLIM